MFSSESSQIRIQLKEKYYNMSKIVRKYISTKTAPLPPPFITYETEFSSLLFSMENFNNNLFSLHFLFEVKQLLLIIQSILQDVWE